MSSVATRPRTIEGSNSLTGRRSMILTAPTTWLPLSSTGGFHENDPSLWLVGLANWCVYLALSCLIYKLVRQWPSGDDFYGLFETWGIDKRKEKLRGKCGGKFTELLVLLFL